MQATSLASTQGRHAPPLLHRFRTFPPQRIENESFPADPIPSPPSFIRMQALSGSVVDCVTTHFRSEKCSCFGLLYLFIHNDMRSHQYGVTSGQVDQVSGSFLPELYFAGHKHCRTAERGQLQMRSIYMKSRGLFILRIKPTLCLCKVRFSTFLEHIQTGQWRVTQMCSYKWGENGALSPLPLLLQSSTSLPTLSSPNSITHKKNAAKLQ